MGSDKMPQSELPPGLYQVSGMLNQLLEHFTGCGGCTHDLKPHGSKWQ